MKPGRPLSIGDLDVGLNASAALEGLRVLLGFALPLLLARSSTWLRL